MTTDLNNILTALAAAKAAQEAVPVLEERNRNLVAELDGKRDHVQRIELTLQERDARINELSEKLRSVEAERDQYGFRELEANDKVAALARSIRAVMGECEGVLATVETDFVPRAKLEQQLSASKDEAMRLVEDVETLKVERDKHMARAAEWQHKVGDLQVEVEDLRKYKPVAPEPMPMGDMQGTHDERLVHPLDREGSWSSGEADPHPFGEHGGGTAQPTLEPVSFTGFAPRQETAPEVAASPTPTPYSDGHGGSPESAPIGIEHTSTSSPVPAEQPAMETPPAATPSDSPPTEYRGPTIGDWHWNYGTGRYDRL